MLSIFCFTLYIFISVFEVCPSVIEVVSIVMGKYEIMLII